MWSHSNVPFTIDCCYHSVNVITFFGLDKSDHINYTASTVPTWFQLSLEIVFVKIFYWTDPNCDGKSDIGTFMLIFRSNFKKKLVRCILLSLARYVFDKKIIFFVKVYRRKHWIFIFWLCRIEIETKIVKLGWQI